MILQVLVVCLVAIFISADAAYYRKDRESKGPAGPGHKSRILKARAPTYLDLLLRLLNKQTKVHKLSKEFLRTHPKSNPCDLCPAGYTCSTAEQAGSITVTCTYDSSAPAPAPAPAPGPTYGPECKNDVLGTDYSGTEDKTMYGETCQAWNSQSPHGHSQPPANFPEGNLDDAKNYCRNPDNDPGGPWCYTTNPENIWDLCSIPVCQGSAPEPAPGPAPGPAPAPAPDLSATSGWPPLGADCSTMYSPDTGKDGQTSGVFQNQPGCGQSTFTGKSSFGKSNSALSKLIAELSRIVGGQFGEAGQWPWHGILGLKGCCTLCGASLIHPQWAITAAHCVYISSEDGIPPQYNFPPNLKPCQWNLRFGTPKLSYAPESGDVDVTASKIFYHADYDPNTIANDIALIKLEHPVPLSDKIKTSCLPSKGDVFNIGETCYVMGYGINKPVPEGSQDQPEQDGKFRYLKVQISACPSQSKYDQFICHITGEIGQGVCMGDSGGSQVCKRGNVWYQTGVLSHGPTSYCASSTSEWNAYTSLEYYLEWINSVMSRN